MPRENVMTFGEKSDMMIPVSDTAPPDGPLAAVSPLTTSPRKTGPQDYPLPATPPKRYQRVLRFQAEALPAKPLPDVNGVLRRE